MRLKHIISDFWIVSINGLGWFGVAFIVYGLLAQFTGQPWHLIEDFAEPVSRALTIIGTMLTAASIYFYDIHPRPPKRISKTVVAPVAVIGCLLALASMHYITLSPVSVNGFAIVGLAGALFRIRGSDEERSEEVAETEDHTVVI